MRSLLQAELEKRFNFNENNKYLVATFLDPGFKTSFLGVVQAERARQNILLEALKLSCNDDESSSTDDDSSPRRKKRNLNENDKSFEIHDSFWNCFEEVAKDNMRNSNDEENVEKNTVANEMDFYLKSIRLD
ncbi:hypothetical protein EVAR_78912_1 [Eumeta japonica]|uniref:Uncharacterized protein n=1 Tax=Eumeta variegata TaxID=151549 RepID=A0A4C1U2D2_EUMVA|nr:hypothetical protein EVAR_78912_1 [Eumeta japonica]